MAGPRPGSVGRPDRDVTLEATPDIAAGRTIQGLVAQRSERGTHNPSVVGSIPTEPTDPEALCLFICGGDTHTKRYGTDNWAKPLLHHVSLLVLSAFDATLANRRHLVVQTRKAGKCTARS